MAKSKKRKEPEDGGATSRFEALLTERRATEAELLLIRKLEYEEFVQGIQDLPTVERARVALERCAEDPGHFADFEALVYLRSQGQDRKVEVSELREWMKEAAAAAIASAHPPIKKGESPERAIIQGGVPRFWSAPLYMEGLVAATIMRAVEWCGIGGYEPWWEEINNQLLEDKLSALPLTHELFYFTRSHYSISCLREGLMHQLRLTRAAREPWVRGHEISLCAAAGYAFGASRLAATDHRARIDEAARLLLRSQNEDGSWLDSEEDEDPSTHTTAKAIHALALAKPHGCELAMERARDWLIAQQRPDGYWKEPGVPLLFLTVAVLDAIELAQGQERVTFRAPGGSMGSDAAPSCSDVDAASPTIPEGSVSVHSVERDYVFARSGTGWWICYQGVCRAMSHQNGFVYIQELLRQPRKPIQAEALHRLTSMARGAHSVEGESDLHLDTSSDSGADLVLDEDAEASYKDRALEIRSKLQSDDELNAEERETMRSELEMIAEQLGKSKGLGKRRRKLGERERNVRKKVGQAISRSIKCLGDQLPLLGQHLVDSIRDPSSEEPMYSPREDVSWRLVPD